MATITIIDELDEVKDSRAVINANFAALNEALTGAIAGFVVVGPTGSGADYECDGVADEVQINQAISACNISGGGTVSIMPGTYLIADTVQIRSNVRLVGAGMDLTTIKAINSYNPVTLAPTNGRALLIAYNSSVSNVTIKGITFDANVQNRAGLDTSSTLNMTIDIKGATNLTFEYNKVTNGINWSVFIWQSDKVWVEHNYVLGGFDSVYNQNDGIHLRSCQHFFIRNNYVDTTVGGGTSGDDCIVAGSAIVNSDRDCAYGVISGNIVSGQSRGILLLTEGTYNTRDIVVANNSINHTYYSGICLDKYTSDTLHGQLINITVDGNDLYDTGFGMASASAIQVGWQNFNGRNVGFRNLTITNNTIRKTNVTADDGTGAGVAVNVKGTGLVISGNNMFDIVSCRGIAVGTTASPIKDVVIANNRIDFQSSGNTTLGMFLYGIERGVVSGNQIRGNGGSSQGMYIQGGTTAGNDNQGVAKIETSKSVVFANNQIYNCNIGINGDSNEDYNQFIGNVTTTCGTAIQKSGTHSVIVSGTNLSVP